METENSVDKEKYKACIDDIEVAKTEIKNMKLYPEDVVAEFYCIPSHNHQAYYAMLSCTDDNYRLTYIKTQVYLPGHKNPIKMYPFALCKKAEKHPGKQGQFMIGTKKLAASDVNVLMNLLDVLPEKYIFEEDGLYLDGVVQGIRALGDNPKAVSKEVFYRDAAKISGLSTKQREFLDDLYLKIEGILS